MTNYQLVAWTVKGQVRMIPSQVTAYIHEELDAIDALSDRIRYGSSYEIRDILEVSSAYEKLGHRLLQLGRIEDAFFQYTQAAQCCLSCSERCWRDYDEWVELSTPLRGRFFAMYLECKELVRDHPVLQNEWQATGLQESARSLRYFTGTSRTSYRRGQYLPVR